MSGGLNWADTSIHMLGLFKSLASELVSCHFSFLVTSGKKEA